MKPIAANIEHCPIFKIHAKFCIKDQNICNRYFSFGKYMQNQVVKELVEKLIEKFDDKSWIPPTHKKYHERWCFIPARSNSNLKQYCCPDITFSEQGTSFYVADKNSDYLGYYDNNMRRIILYTNTIEECADEFANSDISKEYENEFFPYGFEDWEELDVLKHKISFFITVTTTYVLLHNTAHWLVHWLPDSEFQNYSKFNYTQKSEKDFHESIAQLFTWSIIKDFQPMLIFFKWFIMYHQTERYRLYSAITGYEEQDVISCLRFMKLKSKNIDNCDDSLLFNYQNWDYFCNELENMVNMKGSKDVTELSEEQKRIQKELCSLAKNKIVLWENVEPYLTIDELQRQIDTLEENNNGM